MGATRVHSIAGCRGAIPRLTERDFACPCGLMVMRCASTYAGLTGIERPRRRRSGTRLSVGGVSGYEHVDAVLWLYVYKQTETHTKKESGTARVERGESERNPRCEKKKTQKYYE